VLVLLDVEAGAVREGSGFLPSRQVLGRLINSDAIKGLQLLEAGQRCINVASAPDFVQGRCGRQIVTGAHGSGSIGASRAGQV
jgi:hypothetical protein